LLPCRRIEGRVGSYAQAKSIWQRFVAWQRGGACVSADFSFCKTEAEFESLRAHHSECAIERRCSGNSAEAGSPFLTANSRVDGYAIQRRVHG